MASQVFTGTAANHRDLLVKLREHLTDVTMGAQAWSVKKTVVGSGANPRDELYLCGPGLSGSDNIHVNVAAYQNINIDVFNWKISGAVAFNAGVSMDLQPGISNYAHINLVDTAIPYWLVANGRRFILVAKVSTTYQTLYAGYILPYATSAEMPYPVAICGSSGGQEDWNRWSMGTYTLCSPWDPVQGAAYLRQWDGSWLEMANLQYRSDTIQYALTVSCVWPWEADYGIGMNRNGTYGLLPAILHSSHDGGNVFGEYEGIFFVTGFSNASEDIITVAGDQYLVIQSCYRTTRRDYAAIKLG